MSRGEDENGGPDVADKVRPKGTRSPADASEVLRPPRPRWPANQKDAYGKIGGVHVKLQKYNPKAQNGRRCNFEDNVLNLHILALQANPPEKARGIFHIP